MILKEKNNISFFCYPNFEKFKNVFCATFTKDIDVACSSHIDCKTPSKNNLGIKNVLDILKLEKIICLNQEHKDNVFVLKEFDNNLPNNIPSADAVITNQKNLALLIKTADCQAIFLYDSKKHVIANIHSGWRSSVLQIVDKSIGIMKEEFGSNPFDIVAAISPSLCPFCFEFKSYKKDIPQKFWKYKIKENHFDFFQITKSMLKKNNIDNIYTSPLCTKCFSDLFFSHRKDKVKGRLANVIALI